MEYFAEDPIEYADNEFTVLYKFSIDGEIDHQEFSKAFNGEPYENLVFIELSKYEREILKEFDLESFAYYVASTDTYKKRCDLFDCLGLIQRNEVIKKELDFESETTRSTKKRGMRLEKNRNVVLVLLNEGIWAKPGDGLSKSKKDIYDEREKEYDFSEQIRLKFSLYQQMLEWFRIEERFLDGRRTARYANQPNQYILNKVTFEFEDFNNPGISPKIVEIERSQEAIHPLTNLFLRYDQLTRDYPAMVEDDFQLMFATDKKHIINEDPAYCLFCYRFITFLNNHTNLAQPEVSRQFQFRVCRDLMTAASYSTNSLTYGSPDRVEQNFKKYFRKGKKIAEKLSEPK